MGAADRTICSESVMGWLRGYSSFLAAGRGRKDSCKEGKFTTVRHLSFRGNRRDLVQKATCCATKIAGGLAGVT
jgi:hypothetical protein